MITQSVILLPTPESANEMCDFVFQTSKSLVNHKNNVYVVDFGHNYSFMEILSGILHKKKLVFVIVKKGIRFLVPIYLIPFKRFSSIEKLNQFIYFFILRFFLRIRHWNHKAFLCWMFFPHYSHLLFFKMKRWRVIYDIVDYYTFWNLVKNKEIQKKKQYLLQKSDHIFAISQTLKKQYQKLTKKTIFVSPQGFSEKVFKKKSSTRFKLPKTKPIIGFIGRIDERLDYSLLEKLIHKRSDWQFVFIGPKQYGNILSNKKVKFKAERLLSYKNVLWLAKVSKSSIPSLIEQFKVCIIPYDTKLKFNLYSYPMKLFEYFYLKKPVIATTIRELRAPEFAKIVFTSDDPVQWIKYIERLISKSWPKSCQMSQLKMAKENSWNKKVEFISEIIEG